MIEQISSDIETIVDTNNNSNKSFKSLNHGKQTNSLIRLFGNKLKCRRRATSLNDINVKFQSKFSSANSIKLIDETTNPSKHLAGCLNCQNRSTNSQISLLGFSSKANDLNYSKDCCHSCTLHTERSYKIHQDKNGLKNTNLKMFENYSDQRVPVENKNKSSYINDNCNYKNNKTFNNTSSSSSSRSNSSSYNEFENFNSLTFYKQCYVRGIVCGKLN